MTALKSSRNVESGKEPESDHILGARLIRSGAEVQFIARGERLGQPESNRLIVESQLGNFAIPVHAPRQR